MTTTEAERLASLARPRSAKRAVPLRVRVPVEVAARVDAAARAAGQSRQAFLEQHLLAAVPRTLDDIAGPEDMSAA